MNLRKSSIKKSDKIPIFCVFQLQKIGIFRTTIIGEKNLTVGADVSGFMESNLHRVTIWFHNNTTTFADDVFNFPGSDNAKVTIASGK